MTLEEKMKAIEELGRKWALAKEELEQLEKKLDKQKHKAYQKVQKAWDDFSEKVNEES